MRDNFQCTGIVSSKLLVLQSSALELELISLGGALLKFECERNVWPEWCEVFM